MFCGVSHAVDHNIRAFSKQLVEVVSVVPVGPDEVDPSVPQILREPALGLSGGRDLPACTGQFQRGSAAYLPVSP